MKMKREVLAFFVAVVAVAGNSSAAPTTGRHEPDFALTISTKEETVRAQKDMDVVVIVEEKNISNHTVNIGRLSHPGYWYGMTVLLDGRPAPITELYRKLITPKQYGPDELPIVDSFPGTLKPGESERFEIHLPEFFDLSTPGTYEITFTRGTDTGQPDNVDVKSNTITVTVLPADDPPPAQQ
jgi:hypothetical protein